MTAAVSPRKRTVHRFYADLWDRGEVELIPELLHEDFTFRGSLGPVLVGHAQFADYVALVRGALEGYRSEIVALVEEGDRVAGRLRFSGRHRGDLLGFAPTGRHVWWDGAPIFTFDGAKVRDLWVLGDVHGLVERLRADAAG